MIIKKWDSGTTAWVNQSALTNATDLVVDVTAGTPVSIFEVIGSTPKIKVSYLPDSVFDSLYFFTTISGPTVSLSTLANNAVTNGASLNRSALGYYWVATASLGITANTGAVLVGSNYYTTVISPSEEGASASTSGATLEPGDWVVVSKITGSGTSGSPYAVTFAVVNNTYATMTAASAGAGGAPGIVPASSAGDQLKFLRADATWVVPTDTVYTHPNHTGDVTSVGDGATTIAANAVSNSKLADMATSTIKGRATASTGDPEDLTAAQVRTILNVADGANNYSHPTYSATAINTDGVTVLDVFTSDTSGHVTSISTRTLPNATISAAGVMSSTDKAKLDGIEANANNYSHPSYTLTQAAGTETTLSDITLVDSLTTNGTGHLTNATWRKLVAGTNVSITAASNGNITIASTDTNTTYSDGSGIALTGTVFSVEGGEGLTQEASGLKMTYPIYHGDTLPTTGISANALGFEW